MTTKQMTDTRIETRRAALTKQRAERLDPLDYPRVWTQRQVNAYEAETAQIDQQIAAFKSAVGAVAALPSHEPDTRWRDFLQSARKTIDAELLAMPPRIRNEKELEQQQWLTFSIRLIDFGFAANRLPAPIISLASTRIGELMAAAGYDVVGFELLRAPNGFRGSLPDTEQRIKELTKRRADVQKALDAALLTDDERTTQEAESAQLRDTFNAMHVKGSPDGMGYVAYTDDGDVLDVADMTPVQRRAFERMDTMEREYRQGVIDRQMGTS